MALEEAQLKMMKKDIELRQKEKKLADGDYKDELERELLETEILEVKVNMNNIQNSVSGAIRKMNFFTNQYKSILKKLGKDDITEEEYEKEESRYHVMTCMKQALNAARARGGVIDEGSLVWAIENGKIAGAGLDVYADEPFQSNNPLSDIEKVVLTPHVAFKSVESELKQREIVAENIRAVLTGGEPINIVNKEIFSL